jgi:hypothetical protein
MIESQMIGWFAGFVPLQQGAQLGEGRRWVGSPDSVDLPDAVPQAGAPRLRLVPALHIEEKMNQAISNLFSIHPRAGSALRGHRAQET